jgi:hypothetical protein
MFTYKFEGLTAQDDPTGYTYGSLPAKPELGHIIVMGESETRYTVIRIHGDGLQGDGPEEQRTLAWAEISSGKKVPTLWLQKQPLKEQLTQSKVQKHDKVKNAKSKAQSDKKLHSAQVLVALTRSFEAMEVKEWSRENRRIRLSGEGEAVQNEIPSCPEHKQPMRHPTSLRLAGGTVIENLHYCPVEGCDWRYEKTVRYRKTTDF